VRINYSRVQTFQRCPRFYHYRYIRNLVPKKEALPLLIGRAVHAGLASHYAKESDGEAQIKHAFEETRTGAAWLKPELDELTLQEEYTLQIFRWYKEQYPREPWTILAPEVEGHVPLGPHELYFRTDGVVSMDAYPWLLEHKTTSQLGSAFFRKFRLDAQISLYIYAVGVKLGIKPRGAIINAICKSRTFNRATFARDPVTRTQWQLDDCCAQTVQQVNEIERLVPLPEEEYLRHYNECVRYNRTCDYIELCSGGFLDEEVLYAKRDPDYTEAEEEK
jgi:hypothetical protein